MDITDEGQDELSGRIIGAALEVANALGSGFLERVYRRALLRELRLVGIKAREEVSFRVLYKGHSVGEYSADIVVEDRIVLELKCVDRLGNEHMAQCINYLKASGLKVALLINFQRPRLEWKRVVHEFP